jgi:hypothetical protein
MAKLPTDLRPLYREALSEDASDVNLPDAVIAARWTAIERTFATAAAPARGGQAAILTGADLAAFVYEGKELTHEQQRLLFTQPELRERFRALKREFAAQLKPHGERPSHAGYRPLAITALKAAATDDASVYRRKFEGGELRISPVGVGQQVYITIVMKDPRIVPRAFIVERARDHKVVRVALPAPDDEEITFIKDCAVPADAELVALLRDPTSTGDVLP